MRIAILALSLIVGLQAQAGTCYVSGDVNGLVSGLNVSARLSIRYASSSKEISEMQLIGPGVNLASIFGCTRQQPITCSMMSDDSFFLIANGTGLDLVAPNGQLNIGSENGSRFLEFKDSSKDQTISLKSVTEAECKRLFKTDGKIVVFPEDGN